ncbi:efflux RND transporter periplasmic adaptor subunit [Granulicella tundricola]|uniref:Efflux transporter, RND family, MFP subunit n=1 Tax=Granulicella tundricola (strain ATCC BAA-1859 / DSM 23138 / MP5ACTX9) TaxID=1198114 RepID=E8WZV2_GRATM|nr:efflux RND transporter periplasmic adaptor subunit [Granulicella tundricola]ADW67763.1 efflux transporter, RND family, MFP subunit [Granulicella tundricola MP5ACTX9]
MSIEQREADTGSIAGKVLPAMRRANLTHAITLSLGMLTLAGCHQQETNKQAAEAPPSVPQVVPAGQANVVHVDQANQFPLVTTTSRTVFSTLNVTGAVQPDVSRELPVLSIANGRVVALHVGLGDYVKKGQLVMEVQSPDVTTAFGNYLKAVSDEHLTQTTLTRDKLLYDKGAIAQSQLEVAQNGEEDSQSALTATEQQLHILGVDKNHPSELVKVYAPITGVVVSQNTTTAGAAGITFAGAAGSLTIADLSHVWVVCDVYENDLPNVRLGEAAQITLNAFPGKVRTGTISDIGAILDPSIRTAKVRIQVQNPDNLLRIGMFATATLKGATPKQTVAVPANAILHLHDRDYVFVPAGSAGDFRRQEIKSGGSLPGDSTANYIEVLNGLAAGQQVVGNALELQNTAAQ